MAYGPEVGLGATRPHYCTIEGIAKTNSTNSPYTVANEFICGRLALIVGLPVPTGDIAADPDGTVAYMSLRFGPEGERPPPIDPSPAASDHQNYLAGTVVFDCWVANTDRNSGNVAYVPNLVPYTVYDFSHALLGSSDAGLQRLESFRGRPAIGGVLQGHVTSGAAVNDWADRIEKVDPRVIQDTCARAAVMGALSSEEASQVAGFLVDRRTEVSQLLMQAQHDGNALPNLNEWGL